MAAPGAAAVASAEPRLVQQRRPGLEYFLEHNSGQLYLLSNARGALDYAVYRRVGAWGWEMQQWGRLRVAACSLPARRSQELRRHPALQRCRPRIQPCNPAALSPALHLPTRTCRVPTSAPSLAQEQWQLVVGEQPGIANEDMDMTRDWLVLYQRRQGRQQVAALPLRHGLPAAAAATAGVGGARQAGGPAAAAAAAVEVAAQPADPAASLLQLAPLPAWALSVAAGANADFQAQQLRLMLSSPVHPEQAFDWDLASGQLVQPPAPAAAAGAAGVEQQADLEQQLAWRQLWATSADGTAVPLTVACAAEALPPGSRGSSSSSGGSSSGEAPLRPRPCLLVVYGSYGHSLPTGFLAERLPLLHRGWVLALAHVRGGGELGRRWHAAGRGPLKANSLADLEACLDHLFAAGGWRTCVS